MRVHNKLKIKQKIGPKSTKWNQENELRRFKQLHPSQMDIMDPDTGEVKEFSYERAEQQRTKHIKSSEDD